MKQWYETRLGGWAIRIIGIGIILLAWELGDMLTQMLRGHALDQTSLLEILLGMLIFLFTSAGIGLALLGEHLFDPVAISERWHSTDREA